MQRRKTMLLVVTALSSGVTLAACGANGVVFVPPDGGDGGDASSDAHQGPDVLGFGVVDAGIIADDVHVEDASDASDAPSE